MDSKKKGDSHFSEIVLLSFCYLLIRTTCTCFFFNNEKDNKIPEWNHIWWTLI